MKSDQKITPFAISRELHCQGSFPMRSLSPDESEIGDEKKLETSRGISDKPGSSKCFPGRGGLSPASGRMGGYLAAREYRDVVQWAGPESLVLTGERTKGR